jgi:hypothetical protein
MATQQWHPAQRKPFEIDRDIHESRLALSEKDRVYSRFSTRRARQFSATIMTKSYDSGLRLCKVLTISEGESNAFSMQGESLPGFARGWRPYLQQRKSPSLAPSHCRVPNERLGEPFVTIPTLADKTENDIKQAA